MGALYMLDVIDVTQLIGFTQHLSYERLLSREASIENFFVPFLVARSLDEGFAAMSRSVLVSALNAAVLVCETMLALGRAVRQNIGTARDFAAQQQSLWLDRN